MENQTLSTAEVMEYLKVGRHQLYHYVKHEGLPCRKIKGHYLFFQHEVEHWVNEQGEKLN